MIVDALNTKHKRYKTRTNRGKKPTATLREIFEYQSKLGRDIALIFNRRKFVNDISRALQSAIKTFYRN